MSWCADIEQALEELGGEAHLSEIYQKVREIRERKGLPLGQYKAWVRHFLQQNSRGRGRNNFQPKYPVEMRRGIWQLRKFTGTK